MNRPAKFTQADVSRALKGAKAAGLNVGGFEIDEHGKIIVKCGVGAEAAARSPLEAWKAKRAGQHERY